MFQNAEDHVEKTGATLLMTEFADVQDATIHTRVTELADEFMVGWTVWGWFRAAGQIKQDPAKPPTPDNLNQEVLAAVVRPYPRIVAGTPTRFSFDPETKKFEASFSTRLPDGRRARRRLSEIYVPRLHYGRDYRVEVEGARIMRRARHPAARATRAPAREVGHGDRDRTLEPGLDDLGLGWTLTIRSGSSLAHSNPCGVSAGTTTKWPPSTVNFSSPTVKTAVPDWTTNASG